MNAPNNYEQKPMPNTNNLPEIDIREEDPIPF
jgi:hypothetical protein